MARGTLGKDHDGSAGSIWLGRQIYIAGPKLSVKSLFAATLAGSLASSLQAYLAWPFRKSCSAQQTLHVRADHNVRHGDYLYQAFFLSDS